MRRSVIAVVLLAASCLACRDVAHAEDMSDIGNRLIERYIQPATQQFAAATAAVSGAVEFLCREPSADRLEVARQRFGDAVGAWARVSVLRFGPLVEENRYERIFFWPDPRGVTVRQLEQVLSSGSADVLDAATLRRKSVAVQGLPALEFVLFGAGADALLTGDPAGRFRCGYAAAIAMNLALTAEDIRAAWAPGSVMASEFGHPGPDNALYRTTGEVAAETLKAMTTALQFLSEAMIAPFLGREPETANPKLAPLWRSGLSLRLISTNLRGIASFYGVIGVSQVLDAEHRWIDGSIDLELRKARESLETLREPVGETVAGGPDRAALIYTVIALNSIRNTVNERLAPALGAKVGFNALDGD